MRWWCCRSSLRRSTTSLTWRLRSRCSSDHVSRPLCNVLKAEADGLAAGEFEIYTPEEGMMNFKA